MSSFLFTNKPLHKNSNFYCKTFGSKTETFFSDKYTLVYNYLFEDKKIFDSQIVACIDGFIFDDDILSAYKQHDDFLKKIDGEYCGFVLNKKENKLIAFSDTFGTRHISLGIDGKYIGVSSFQKELELLGFKNIFKVYANTAFYYDIKKEQLDIEIINSFDTANKDKKDFNDWNTAFETSLLRRTSGFSPVSLTLTEGMDTGIIHCGLEKFKIPYNLYTVWKDGFKIESIDTLFKRMKYPALNKKIVLGKNIFDFIDEDYQIWTFMSKEQRIINILNNNLNDFYRLGEVCRISSLNSSNLLLTGVNGDIIYLPNFTQNYNINFSIIEQCLATRASICPNNQETRFILCDKTLYQESQYLHSSIIKEYKQPYIQYLENHKYPIYRNKRLNYRAKIINAS